MIAKIYKKIRAMITNDRNDLHFCLKMSLTYLPLFVLSMLTSFACYDMLLGAGSSDFNVIRVVGPLSVFFTVFLSSRIAVLDERYKFNKLEKKQSEQEII